MKNNNKSSHNERGQALIIITFAIIGLIGMTGLTVDGGMAYSDRRHAQNAADSAAFAAALAHAKGSTNDSLEDVAKGIATANGYDNNQVSNTVELTWELAPRLPVPGGCPEETTAEDNLDITVNIVSHIDTTFATMVGIRQMTNAVTATTRACGIYIAPIFGGNAITSLNSSASPCAFDSSTGSAEWVITGGGIFSNNCALATHNVTLDTDPYQCVSAVDYATGFDTGQVCPGTFGHFDQNYIDGLMPPNPCDGTAGDVGIFPPNPPNAPGSNVEYTNGVYCISNFGQYDKLNINLVNATLYVTDMEFNLNFSGSGGFSGTPTQDPNSDYSNYYMVIAPNSAHKCVDFTDNNSQVLRYVGNGAGELQGTVLAPTACVDLRGNGTAAATLNSQIIAYTVTANGSAQIDINFDAGQNHQEPEDAKIRLLK